MTSDGLARVEAQLSEELASFDWPAATTTCDALIARIHVECDPLPESSVKRLMQKLRRKRRFGLMQRLAEALLHSGQDTPYIRRQYAQALIDLGLTTAPELLLNTLLTTDETVEASGLEGRIYKQLYVNSSDGGNRGACDSSSGPTATPSSRPRAWNRLDRGRRSVLPQASEAAAGADQRPRRECRTLPERAATERRARQLPVLQRTYEVDDVVWSSPVGELAAAFLSLKGEPPPTDPMPLEGNPVVLGRPAPRLYIVGLPGGRDVGFSLQDNYLLACNERVLHYRTPTEPGSSGSPVFEPHGWRVVALHHAGSLTTPRIDGEPGSYEANVGIAIRAIRSATMGT